MSPEDVQSIIIQNSHRIPRNSQNIYKPGAPDALIVKFSRMEDRNKVLNQARITTLPKGMAVRTDLPSQLKKKRGELAHKAYRMKKYQDHRDHGQCDLTIPSTRLIRLEALPVSCSL